MELDLILLYSRTAIGNLNDNSEKMKLVFPKECIEEIMKFYQHLKDQKGINLP